MQNSRKFKNEIKKDYLSSLLWKTLKIHFILWLIEYMISLRIVFLNRIAHHSPEIVNSCLLKLNLARKQLRVSHPKMKPLKTVSTRLQINLKSINPLQTFLHLALFINK